MILFDVVQVPEGEITTEIWWEDETDEEVTVDADEATETEITTETIADDAVSEVSAGVPTPMVAAIAVALVLIVTALLVLVALKGKKVQNI